MELYSTKEQNQSSDIGDKPVWVFGYGSLIYKVDFDYIASKKGYVQGWQRRFWMASQDHRGTPSHPGRVLTLCKADMARCFGIAYLIEPEVLTPLDHREQNGYLRQKLSFECEDGEVLDTITYIGDPKAPVYQEEHDNQKLAEQIYQSVGPSGPNIDYLLDTANALRELGEHDAHIFDIEMRVRAMMK